jgi:predicted patatin/cPLA2 family phospholipase
VVTLVIEGGATRAAYASGVAESLQRAGLVPDAIYGTSAGGAIGAWYAAGQAHVSVKTWDSVVDRRLLSYRRALWGSRPILDFKLLYSDMYPNHFKMNLAALRSARFPVFVTVTDADTLDTVYPDLRTAADPLVLLHATSAMPIISEAPVLVEGRRLVDGGTTQPLPLAKAIEDGRKDILVISNRVRGERAPESAFAVRLIASRFPTLTEAAENHHRYHNDALRLAEAPPAGVQVRIVRPSRDLGLSRLTRDLAIIRRGVEEGRKDGAEAALDLGLSSSYAP